MTEMPEARRAIMLGIRHRCGQEVQFWIPVHLVPAIAGGLEDEVEILATWMKEEGFVHEQKEADPENLVEQLSTEFGERGIGFVNVETDASICPRCGSLLPWLEALTEYVRGRKRGE